MSESAGSPYFCPHCGGVEVSSVKDSRVGKRGRRRRRLCHACSNIYGTIEILEGKGVLPVEDAMASIDRLVGPLESLLTLLREERSKLALRTGTPAKAPPPPDEEPSPHGFPGTDSVAVAD